MKKLNFIDIFCGAGGLSCGLEQAGLRCILGIDHDKNAIKTFERNHKHASSFSGRIEELDNTKLYELIGQQPVDLVVGGPPCQGFSTVGKGDPNDERNRLFMEFLRIVKRTKPTFIIIENVTGLLAKKNEKTLKKILKYFQDIGYTLDVKVMSAQNYGVAEKRRRTIILGSLINSQITFPKPTHDVEINRLFRPAVTVGEVLSNLHTKDQSIYNHDLEHAKIKNSMDLKRLKRIPEGQGIRYQKDEKAYLTPTTKLGIIWEELPEQRLRQTKYQRLSTQCPSPTIMTHRHSYYHPTEHRYLTQREAAAIQSFPNDFVFEGTVSAQWRQIGNAVPPLLGKALGKAILNMYKRAEKNATTIQKKKTIKEIKDVRSNAFRYRLQK